MKLSIVLATRTRPGTLVRTVEATLANITHKDTRLVIAADDDDAGTLSMRGKLTDPRIIWSVEEREDSLGEKYNRVLTVAPADVYLVMVDYAPHVTPGFDEKIIEAARMWPDGYAVIYNHLANLSFPQINAVTHKLAMAMGGIYPKWFPYWFIDHWLDDMAKLIDRIVFADVLVDCSARPGTMERREPGFWGWVFDMLCVERRKIAHDIIDAEDFHDLSARKRVLKRNHPLVDERSCMINRSLGQLEAGPPPDDRYMRIKTKALEYLAEVRPDVVTRNEPEPEDVRAEAA